MQKENLAVLVVLYGKENFSESATLLSFLKCSFPEPDKIRLIVVNNGPFKLNTNDEVYLSITRMFTDLQVHEFLENKPLSKVYNKFIEENQADKYIILDDDSNPDISFFNMISETQADIVFPEIVSKENGKKYYPLKDSEPTPFVQLSESLDINNTMSITSGLVISSRLVNILKGSYTSVFDERYALYGIDTSFVFRVRRVSNLLPHNFTCLSEGKIIHSLSKVTDKKSLFRDTERLYDVAITTRWYPEYYGYRIIFRKLVANLAKLKFRAFITLVTTYISGIHKRCQ